MRKSVKVGVASAGLLLIGSPAAAQGDMSSFGNVGIANGIQAQVPIQVPVNFCGNAIGILGSAVASCTDAFADASLGGSAHYVHHHGHHHGHGHHGHHHGHHQHGYHGHHGHGHHGHTHGDHGHGHHHHVVSNGGAGDMDTVLNIGIANGIQAEVPVQVPLNICGNAIGILGDAMASCIDAHADASLGGPHLHGLHHDHGHGHGHNHNGVNGAATNGPVSLADRKPSPKAKPSPNGKPRAATPIRKEQGLITQLISPVTDLLGSNGNGHQHGHVNHVCNADDVDMNSALNVGIANGIQAYVPVQVPVNFTGNAIGLGGTAAASSSNTSSTARHC